MNAGMIHPIEIFYSYAAEDSKLRNKLEQHLSGMESKGMICGWHEGLITAGTDRIKEIASHLNSAHIILLLVSPDYISSNHHQNPTHSFVHWRRYQ